MATVAEEISNLGRLVEGHLSDAEYQEYRERLLFLKECKEKGFKRLEKIGPDMGGIDLTPDPNPRKKQMQQMPDSERKKELEGIVARVEAGEALSAVCAELKIHLSTVYGWSKRFGIKIPSSRWYLGEELQNEVIDAINDKGMSLEKACREIGGSPQGIKSAIAKRGMCYNAKERKIEHVTD
jgi:hypothetical protein